MTATLSTPSATSPQAMLASALRYRVLVVATHPVQYASPVFREMARHPQLDVTVAYCSLQGAEAGVDPEFGTEVKWDVPLLDGYAWTPLPNWALRPGLGRFFGLINPSLWSTIRKDRFDAVLFLTGYVYSSFWIGLFAAKCSGIPVFFGTDATTIDPMKGAKWKRWVKSIILPHIYARADTAFAASAATQAYLESLGVPPDRVAIMPLVVDNQWWVERAAAADPATVRARWGVPAETAVVLFCAKLQPWKRPADLLEAFAKAAIPSSHLVFAGEGPLKTRLQETASRLGISDRVRFLGFVNQTQLPEIYSAADLFVLPSQYDACPAVVCETMLCGTPAIISDEIRGRFDLVLHGETGFIFPCGNVDALASTLEKALTDRERLARLGRAARKQMENCSPATNVASFVAALDRLAAKTRQAG